MGRQQEARKTTGQLQQEISEAFSRYRDDKDDPSARKRLENTLAGLENDIAALTKPADRGYISGIINGWRASLE